MTADGEGNIVRTYTNSGQPKNVTDSSGQYAYQYDALGRLIKRSSTNTAGPYNVTYGYDRSSNLTTVTDGRGTTTNAFDDSGVVTQLTYASSSGNRILGFAVDDRGRRTDSWLRTDAARSTWTAHTHQDYDTSGRVTRVIAEVKPGTTATTVTDVSYCYNSASAAPPCGTSPLTDRSKLQWERNNLTGQVTAYTYDTAGRLLTATQSGGTGANTYTYTYDQRGNRLSATVTGATPSSQTLTYNAANQVTNTGYTYDGTGNLTADPSGTYSYNKFQQMTTANVGGTTYTYSYAGTDQVEVLSQQSGTVSPKLSYGRSAATGLPVIERVSVTSSQQGYVENDPVTGEPLMVRDTGGNEALYVYSGTGSPIALIIGTGSVAAASTYDPYGLVTSSSGTTSGTSNANPFTFKNGIQDRATGWVHYGNRWYNSALGRWTQQDTLDVPLDPGNANRYAYAGADPVNNADPTGREYCSQSVGCYTDPETGYDTYYEGELPSDPNPLGTAGCFLSIAGAAFLPAPPVTTVAGAGLALYACGTL